MEKINEAYGFRFSQTLNQSFHELFAVGHQRVMQAEEYKWDGMKRGDGPLLLFQYTLSGKGRFWFGGESHDMTAGRAFLAEIPSEHLYELPDESEEWEFVFILFRPQNLSVEWHGLVERMGRVVELPPESAPVVLLQTMIHLARKDHIQDGFKGSYLVYQFMMELYRYNEVAKKNRLLWDDKVQQAVAYMEDQFMTIQSLDEIAAAVGLSKYYFSRLFLKTTGSTPIEYLSKIRIRTSITLLSETDRTIDDIAQAVGYANGSYFIKVFRQWVGDSPGEFRRSKSTIAFNHFTFD